MKGAVRLIAWFDYPARFLEVTHTMREMARAIEAEVAQTKSFIGFCDICEDFRTMSVRKPAAENWCNLREYIYCECGFNGRQRLSYKAIKESLSSRGRVLVFEQVTPFFGLLKARLPNVRGCEYLGPCHRPGETVQLWDHSVRHEDMAELSFPDATFDFIFHGDVLEHLPYYQRSLQECHRVLKSSGEMVFTCPFFHNLSKNIARATIEDGQRIDHMTPEYHGNPVSENGAIVFTMHGMQLLQDIKAAGFSRAQIGMCYDPVRGILSNNKPYEERHMWPVVFRAQK